MEAFCINIAGVTAQVQPLFMSTRDYCGRYLSDDAPEFFVEVLPEDLIYEQNMADIEADAEGLKRRRFTDPFLERSAIQRKIAMELIRRDVILLHGSTVAVDGQAYLFTAPCGTGKSTHTRLWRETFGQRAVMVNDDKTFIKVTDTGIFAFGSPWSGKHGLDSNICCPLRGICFLQRGPQNRIRPAVADARLGELLHQTMLPENADLAAVAEQLVTRLSKAVSLWEMECTREQAAALVAYEAMQ